MDLTLILALASGLILILLMSLLFRQYSSGDAKGEDGEEQVEGVRRAGGGRNARARLRAAAAAAENDPDADEDADQEKMGAKKRAKLEAKAEKKSLREAEEKEREERKRKKELAEEERKKEEAKQLQEEERQLEEERKAKEEKERREREEYLRMKETFSIEEEGFDENEGDPQQTLQDFLSYIKNNKVVLLEDLAAHFRLKTQAVISRIQDLQANGTLTGVIDDRGKFIFISQQELESVAKFVKQRGRVSISEIVENSQNLINLSPSLVEPTS